MEKIKLNWENDAATEEPIQIKQIAAPKTNNKVQWGNAAKRKEVVEYEKFILETMAPLAGLPTDIKLLPGDCVGISAPTGSGKTTALIGIAIKNLKEGKHVLILTLEETEQETRTRIIRQLGNHEELDDNLGIVEVEGFKESTFQEQILSILKEVPEDTIILIDYINDYFMNFDKTKTLQAYEKIKYTVSTLAAINHKIAKKIMVIGVQATAPFLKAKEASILVNGKAFFEGGQSTIKPLQYAILLREIDAKDGYEKRAYLVKSRNVLVGGKNIVVPTYGIKYSFDQYSYDFLGSLKTINSTDTDTDDVAKPTQKAKPTKAGDF